MEPVFDLSGLTEEQLQHLLGEVQAALLERQREHLRECTIERIPRYWRSIQKACVFRLSWEKNYIQRSLLVTLERKLGKSKESKPIFAPFQAHVGELLELEFLTRSDRFRSCWYLVGEDGSLRALRGSYQERLAKRYVVEHLSLHTLLEQLRVGKTWDELLEESSREYPDEEG
ncbi:MAG TPA: hypothetical protein VGN34_24495 [Ktedonobacteraceae bacterium]|jgi:hypothetical protein